MTTTYKPFALIAEDPDDPDLIKIADYMRGLGFRITAQTPQHYLENLSNFLPIAVFRTDLSGKITYVNSLYEEVTGYSMQDMLGRPWHELIRTEDIPSTTIDKLFSSTAQLVKKNGKGINIFMAICPHHNPINRTQIEGNWGAFFSMDEYLHHHEDRRDPDTLDPLTQIINRVTFIKEVDKSVTRAQRRHIKNALIKIDIDSFRNINEAYGMKIGDAYLKEIALRLKSIARDTDFLARMGEDEFAFLLDEITDTHSIAMVIKRIKAALEKPIIIDIYSIKATSCIGVSIYPDLALTSDALIRTAYRALMKAKSIGPDTIQYDSDAINVTMYRNTSIFQQFENAFKMNEFYLVYQPQVNLETGLFSGYEALLRWNNAALGEVPPAEFIPLAENTTFIQRIGHWVYEQAIEQHAKWLKKYPDPMMNAKISINLSAHQLQDEDLLEWMTAILVNNNLSAHQVILELTETGLMNELEYKIKKINGLRALGFGIALDDFGTVNSSLTLLQKIPFTQLKIDQSFVRTMFESKKSEAIVRTVINLSSIPDTTIVAEGVENDLTLRYLKDNKCHLGQGFYLSKPLSSEEMELYIKNYQ